jgi:hypothetical protein
VKDHEPRVGHAALCAGWANHKLVRDGAINLRVDASTRASCGAYRASHGADAWRYLSLSWRAAMREPEPEKVPIGLPLPDITMDQFMDIDDGWSWQEERV